MEINGKHEAFRADDRNHPNLLDIKHYENNYRTYNNQGKTAYIYYRKKAAENQKTAIFVLC